MRSAAVPVLRPNLAVQVGIGNGHDAPSRFGMPPDYSNLTTHEQMVGAAGAKLSQCMLEDPADLVQPSSRKSACTQKGFEVVSVLTH